MEKKSIQLRKALILMGLGAFIVLGTLIFSLGGFNAVLKCVVTSQTQLKFNSNTWNLWKDIPIPIYLKVYFFNITNPEDFAKGDKPILQEVGPYIYREHLYKKDITMNQEKDTVKYRQCREYFFESELSNGNETDVITMINIPFVAVAKIAHDLVDIDYIFNALDEMVTSKGERLIRRETVHDILWGFSVTTFVDLANSEIVKAVADVQLPAQITNGKMGILRGKNKSDEGWFEVRTGQHSYEDFGHIVKYNGNTTMTVWKGESCNMLNGTDGIVYPPFLNNKHRLYVVVPDMCRSIPFDFTETVEHDGIPGMRFRQPRSMYEAPKKNPDNWCFCPSPNDIDKCQVDGLLSIEPCVQGAPIYVSQPHLLFADDEIRNSVVGLEPDEEKHWGYMDLFPTLGIALEAKHRIQFNLQIQQWQTMLTFEHVPNLYLPILWIEEGATLGGINKTLTKLLVVIVNIWSFGKYMFGLFGLVLVVVGYYKMKQEKKKSPSEILRHLHLRSSQRISAE